ncbi:ER membrane protein complex subunit 10 [Anastrepha obliqua]|uniref:ER membrane protein complex subunit 10 n=1 Tax=Anastrepha obliqua TaxID=95512 RepID=UPI0024090E0B|nr:ER membrane protein complex subunit 10 [Anastrepha obliqua]
MDYFHYIYCIVALLIRFQFCLGYLEYDNWVNIQLSHAVDVQNQNNFIYRGNVTIASLDNGMAKTSQETLTDNQRAGLRSLGQANQLYRLKADVIYANGKRKVFFSATRACNLMEAQLNDVLWVSVDNSGYVNAITILTSGSQKCFNEEISTFGLEDFNTDVLIRHTEMAPFPDTTSFIQKVEREREARERGESRDNRGFFAKYWMYIVPVGLLLFISGATNQDASK